MSAATSCQFRLVEGRARDPPAGSADAVHFLGYPDGELVPSLELRKKLTRLIRKYKPDVVICGEGEETAVELMRAAPRGDLAGIDYVFAEQTAISGSQPVTGIGPLKLGHLASCVDDCKKSAEFYCKVLGKKSEYIAHITGIDTLATALAFAKRYDPATIVVRQQRSAVVTKLLVKLRDRFGNTTILKDGAARKVLSVVRAGGIVAILADIAVPQREGVLTEFLGRPAWSTSLPAIIAQKTGCALLPGFASRENGRLVVDFYPPVATTGLDTVTITTILAKHIEKHIASHPDEWFWFYRRWKGAPAPDAAID